MDVLEISDRKYELNELINFSENLKGKIKISNISKIKIIESRNGLETFLSQNKIAYGINTGFGSLKDKIISKDQLDLLQYNLIVSTAVGIGIPINYKLVRLIILLKIINLSQGYSGVTYELIEKLIEIYEKNFLPIIPESGSLGASGDLVPLSHLVAGIMGIGNVYDLETNTIITAKKGLEKLNIKPLKLVTKEGLALINGTQFITSVAADLIINSYNILNYTIKFSAMCLIALRANPNAFNEKIHKCKDHTGQLYISNEIRKLLENYIPNNDSIQDAYSLRCIPQILGPIFDSLEYAKNIVNNEINSVSDNPLIFNNEILSGGNFHGLYISLEMDKLCICLSNLCNLIERIIDRCVNRYSNGFLSSFLVKNPGLNCGLMIPQYVAAGIAAENRIYASPASIHNIPTCENIEDIVPMGGNSVNKCKKAIENCYKLLSIFALISCQTLDLSLENTNLIQNTLNELYKKIRHIVPIIENDIYMKDYIDNIEFLLKKY